MQYLPAPVNWPKAVKQRQKVSENLIWACFGHLHEGLFIMAAFSINTPHTNGTVGIPLIEVCNNSHSFSAPQEFLFAPKPAAAAQQLSTDLIIQRS